MKALKYHLDDRHVNFVIAGNGLTLTSLDPQGENNHEEVDSLLIHCLCISPLSNISKTCVFASDTDIFALLMKHPGLIGSNNLYMNTSYDEYLDIDSYYSILGELGSSALHSVHCLTGCDTSGKFIGKSKETWIKLFIQTSDNDKMLKALETFQSEINSTLLHHLETFICMGYLPKLKSMSKERFKLLETRWIIFKRSAAESEKLQLTHGSFLNHVRRAHYQLFKWFLAAEALIPVQNPRDYGWDVEDGDFVPLTSDIPIAPKAVIDLVSCKCPKGSCTIRQCGCVNSNNTCTQFCGCDEGTCENADPLKYDLLVDEIGQCFFRLSQNAILECAVFKLPLITQNLHKLHHVKM